MTEPFLPDLERERAQLYARFGTNRDFPAGNVERDIPQVHSRNCARHPWRSGRLWTRSAGGTTRTRQLAPAERESRGLAA